MLVRPVPTGALKAPLAAWVLPIALSLGCSPAKIDFTDTGPVGQDDTDPDDTDTGPDTVTDGALSVTPATLDYGVVFVGQTGVLEVAVQNVGDGEVGLSVALADASVPFTFTVPGNPAPGETVTIAVTFAPTDFGEVTGSLVIADTLGDGEVTVALAGAAQVDADADGVGSTASGGTDCDDANAAAYPGADEIWYDGVDQDCLGGNDYDRDGDGAEYTVDCDDGNAAAYPGADEVWYDGIDGDCAGDDDFDQDADGFTVGTDCDDEDAAVNPAADEVWYDGTDQDCDGVDDDQDLDGYGVADDCNDLDATVNPGATETWYDGVDGDCAGDDDYDQDGDGVTVDTDCVDTDPTVTGPVTETLDGLDSDCDGIVDDVAIGDAASGWLYGGVASLGLGDADGLSLGGDLTGDGADDLVVSSDNYTTGYAFVVSGAVAAAAAGNIDSYDTAVVTGPSAYYPLGNVVGPATDVTGDGKADLLVTGSNTSYGYGYGWVLAGGSSLTGSLSTNTTYSARFEGDSSGDSTFWIAGGDVDGDGVGDVVQAAVTDNWTSGYYSGDTAAGNVSVHSGAVSGTYDIQDADDEIHGSNDYDYFGTGLVVADFDGDGYADILAGAGYNDDGGSNAGAVYLMLGNASLSWDDRADEAAEARITGTSTNAYLGGSPLAAPGDVDGDGKVDLAVASSATGKAYLFWDASSLSGSMGVSAADLTISGTAGSFGSSLAYASDLDGDGATEIYVGDSGNDTAGTDAGAVWRFQPGTGTGGTWTSTNASAVFWGAAAGDGLGTGLAGGGDADDDGRDDLLAGATGSDGGASGGGAVYVILGE